MTHRVFVSFYCVKAGRLAFGNSIVCIDRAISDMEHINDIAQLLQFKEELAEPPTIISFVYVPSEPSL